MRGAGYTLLATDLIGMGYAKLSGNKQPFSSQLRQWWANGWNAANAGTPNGR